MFQLNCINFRINLIHDIFPKESMLLIGEQNVPTRVIKIKKY